MDAFEKRQPHFPESARIVGKFAAGSFTRVMPAHGLTTIYDLVRKHASKPDAEKSEDRVLRHFIIGNLDPSGWTRARNQPRDNFEDATVATVAEETNSALITTRIVGDLSGVLVGAITSSDF